MSRRNTINKVNLLDAATTTATGNGYSGHADYKTYSLWGKTTAGAGSVTAEIEGSNNGGLSWDATAIGTITVTLSTSYASDSFTSTDRFEMVRARITAISGTGATVSAEMCF